MLAEICYIDSYFKNSTIELHIWKCGQNHNKSKMFT